MYTTVEKFGVSTVFYLTLLFSKDIKLIKDEKKDIHNDTSEFYFK